MTRDEWIAMSKQAVVVLRKEIATQDTEQALATLKAFEDHLVNPPSFKAETLWLVRKWASYAKKNTKRAPQFSFTSEQQGPNVLKFTDDQFSNLILLFEMVFDGLISINTKTGTLFAVGHDPKKRDVAKVLQPGSIAIQQREQ